MMTSIRFVALASFAAVVSMAPTAKADEWDKKTILTIRETITLPNATLEPGVYTFKLLDSLTDRHIVQVFDKDGMHLITTVLAIPNYRLQPTDKSSFAFWEVPAGNPPAMRAWFYPGDNFGQEFVYPKNLSTQIASTAKVAVPTSPAVTPEEYKTAPIETVDERGHEANLDTKAYAAPTPAPAPAEAPRELAAAAAPVPAPVETPAELPHTASPMPLIGLVGLASMFGFLALRANRVR